MEKAVLEGLTVLELCSGVAASYCSRILRAHGARVTMIEPPGGDANRALVPRSINSGESGLFAWLNAGKESVCLNLPAETDGLMELAMAADVCVFDDTLPKKFDLPDHLISCDISWFGRSGRGCD